MKKMHILQGLFMLTCMLSGVRGLAQYNQTFTDDAQQAVDIVDATDAGGTPFSCMLATSSNYPIILHKRDFTGAATPSLDFGYSFINSGMQIDPTQLLFTPNEEYIVVGSIWHSSNNVRNPFAARFDVSGNMIWMYEYGPNTIGGSIGKVSICRVEDDPVESYILVTGNNGPNNSSGIFDESICALKINAAGIQMWSYRYYPPATPIVFGTNYLTDQPETILYVDPTDGSSDKYYIGGTTIMQIGMGGFFRNGFCMSIDKNGFIVDPYQQVPVYGMRNQRAIFDAATGQVVIAYTCSNSYMSTTSASLIGLSRFSGTGLAMGQTDFYAHASSTESAGVGIREDRSGNYVVACEVYHTNPTAPTSACAAMLKVNKLAPNLPIFFKEYNYQTYSGNTNIISLFDGVQESYVMGVSRKAVPLGARGISTNTAGTTCGDVTIPYVHTNVLLVPKSGTYTRVSNPAPQTPMYASPTPLTTTTDCDPANPHIYRLSGNPDANPLSPEETAIAVYPTLLSYENEISIEVFTDQADNLDITIYAMDGRKVTTQHKSTVQGSNVLKADVAALINGNYLVNIRTLSGTINQTVKISKMQ